MDTSWYRTLAGSRYESSRWMLKSYEDEKTPQKQPAGVAGDKVVEAMHRLRLCAFEAVQIFNHYCASSDHITLLVLEDPPHFYQRGLMFLRYSSQIRLLREDPHLTMTLLQTRSYPQQPTAQSAFLIQEDELGHIIWRSPHGQLWDEEQLIKCVLKELVKHA